MRIDLLILGAVGSLIFFLRQYKNRQVTTRTNVVDFAISFLMSQLVPYMPLPIIEDNLEFSTIAVSFCANSIYNMIVSRFTQKFDNNTDL